MLLQVERSHLSWVRRWIRMPAGHLPLEICPTGQRPWGSPRACLRDYLSHLAVERRGVPQEEQVREMDVQAAFFILQPQ